MSWPGDGWATQDRAHAEARNVESATTYARSRE
jgi:hypothetical protein